MPGATVLALRVSKLWYAYVSGRLPQNCLFLSSKIKNPLINNYEIKIKQSQHSRNNFRSGTFNGRDSLRFFVQVGHETIEISMFSLNNVIVRLTKIMNKLGKDLKILIFKVIFQHQKLVKSFQFFFCCKEYLIRRPNLY